MASATSFGLLALAIAPLVFTMPAHASDKISISLGNNSVSMQKSASIYDSSSSVTVHNSNDYGFSLSMHATNPDLVNDSYPEYRINPVTGANGQLGANQWGYNLDGSNRFSKVPGSSSEAVSIASVSSDNKGNCSSLKDCSFKLNFGANINPKKMVSGTYSTYVVYTATSKPKPYVPPTPPTPVVPPKAKIPAYATSSCTPSDGRCRIVDDGAVENTVPIKYNSEDGEWYSSSTSIAPKHYDYDYERGEWATLAKFDRDFGYKYVANNREYVNISRMYSVVVYVPRFVARDGKVYFCNKDDAFCNGASNVFSGDNKYGFWISMSSLCPGIPKLYRGDTGVKNYINDEYFQPSLYRSALSLANVLVKALGSPCR